MKIGVLSDTHIPDRAQEVPEKIIRDFRNVDMILHAGDLVDLAVVDKLKSVCAQVKAVWGNMDPREVRKRLPEKDVIQVGKYRIGLMHGYGHPANLIDLLSSTFANDGVDVIVFGHSHVPFNEKREGVLYFNPGSATDKVFSPYNSYGIMEINDEIKARIIKL